VIDDRTVPFVVLALVIVIAILGRPVARRRSRVKPQTLPPGPEAIERLAEALGVGIIVDAVDPGPPVRIVATGLLDGGTTRLTGVGATEDEAWRDLARAAIAWKRDDGRMVRWLIGGG
jgi:hypothetical protein